MAGVNIVRVPYRGSGPALNALISGQVQMMVSTTAAGWPHVKSGRLRALAVTTAQPTALAPGLSTVATTGLPGYQSATVYGIFAPAKTPAAIINRLNEEIVRVLKLPEVKDRFFNAGVEIVASTPEQLAATVKSEMTVLGKLIKDVGIREE
jgi:tripartite-type tricarboxylate transporter receptor subunit TctC